MTLGASEGFRQEKNAVPEQQGDERTKKKGNNTSLNFLRTQFKHAEQPAFRQARSVDVDDTRPERPVRALTTRHSPRSPTETSQ